jgi:hypothetical protein
MFLDVSKWQPQLLLCYSSPIAILCLCVIVECFNTGEKSYHFLYYYSGLIGVILASNRYRSMLIGIKLLK